jgi:hypothetical protein
MVKPAFTGFVIQKANGTLIAVDRHSGGYPYDARGISSVEVWPTFEKAHAYWKVFENGVATSERWKIKAVSLIVETIPGV